MDKKAINTRLIQEMEKFQKQQVAENEDENSTKTTNSHKKAGKRAYSDVRSAFEKVLAPSMVAVMKTIGISDDETGTNRSLFRKKVYQEKNKDNGSYYQFDEKELDAVRTALELKN